MDTQQQRPLNTPSQDSKQLFWGFYSIEGAYDTCDLSLSSSKSSISATSIQRGLNRGYILQCSRHLYRVLNGCGDLAHSLKLR